MIKVLIVDDEMLVRLGIRSLIDWEKHGFTISGDAANGQEALEMIGRDLPAIILTDIIMPNLDGLELIKIVKERYPQITIIVLSCHNDYDYVRQALKLGAADYLLKLSMRPHELLTLLQEHSSSAAVTAAGCQLRDCEADPEKLSQCLDGQSPTLVLQGTEYLSVLREYVFLLFKIAAFEQLDKDRNVAEKSLRNLARQQSREVLPGVVWRYGENELVCLVDISEWDGGRLEARLMEMGNDLVIAAKRFLNLSITIGVSTPQTGAENIRQGYRQAKAAQQFSFYEGTGRVYYFRPDYFQAASAVVILSQVTVKAVANFLESGDALQLLKVLESIFGRMRQFRPPLDLSTRVFLDLIYSYQTVFKEYQAELEQVLDYPEPLYKIVLNFETLVQAQDWFTEFTHQCCRRLATLRNELYREEIRRLVDYLKMHYSENLSLKWAAEYTNLSESYLSRLFKLATQKNFIEYLTGLRMEKAVELLRHTDLPSYLIAEQVGYDNFNYFGRLFKKLYGVSPSEYRKG